MKRIQLFEFEDFDWFPTTIRTGMTNLIVVLHKMVGTKDVLAALMADTLKKHSFSQVVDLGSGSGGIMPEAIEKLNEANTGTPVNLILTDLHPNQEFVNSINEKGMPHVRFSETSLDARHLSNTPAGLKTMVNSFHHMPPDKAHGILISAQKNRQPLLIYEMGENFVPVWLWWLLLPLSLVILIIMVIFMTPFVRPLTWQQIVFTYFIPLIPVFYAWDGQATTMRTYTFDDLNGLLEGMKDESYTWEMAPAKKPNGKKLGYYLLGLPK